MNQQLFEDARDGFTTGIIPKLYYNPAMSEWTPLHIACLSGKENFAREFLQENPGFLELVNPDGCTALHLASSNGHSGIIDLLLTFRGPDDGHSVIRELCMKKDKDGRNPLHCAVVKENVQIVQKLLQTCPESALELTEQKQTVFHLAVKNKVSPSSQVFQALLDGPYVSYLLNLADKEGNTVLHLAIIRKHSEIINLLIAGEPNLDARPVNSCGSGEHNLDVNAVNSSGLTPLDVLVVDPLCGNDIEIERIITSAGGIRLNESYERRENLKNVTSGLLVMASFTAAASWQIAIFLQGGTFWSTDTLPRANFTSISNSSITTIQNPAGNTTQYLKFDSEIKRIAYSRLVFLDTVAFVFSLGLILLLLTPIPSRFYYVKWIISRIIISMILCVFLGLYITLLMPNPDTNVDAFVFVIFFTIVLPILGFFLVSVSPNE